jgi:hypothetical protein
MLASETSADPAAPASPLCRECRVHERYSCDVKTSCQPPTVWGSQELHWQAEIRNIAQGGLALVLRRRFEKGTGLAVELPGPDAKMTSTVLVRVVRVTPQPDGFWLLGCAFVSDLSEEEVRALAAHADKAAKRQAEDAGNEVRVDGVQLEGVLADGQLVHRWMDQLYLHEVWPVAAGRRFVLRTNQGAGGKKGIRLRVESCLRPGPHWILRCKFLDDDPAQIRSVLGGRNDS